MSKTSARPDEQQETKASTDNTSSTEGDGDLVAEVEAIQREVDAAMPRVERAAYKRELTSSLRRATWAAERLAELLPEEAGEAERESEADEAPVTEPARPNRRSIALLSDGRVALSLAYVEGADLAGYERWEGIILATEQAEEMLYGIGEAADEVAANVGGSIRWKKSKPEGGDEP